MKQNAVSRPRGTRWGATGLAALLLAIAPAVIQGHARAEEPQEQSEEDKKMELAGKHYKEGIKLFRQELYKSALESFKRAHKLAPKFPKPLYNIAKSYEKLGIAQECVSWYGKYVDVYKKANGTEPPDMVDINNTVAKCKMGLRLEITIETDPPGAEVYIDSATKIAGTTPYKTRLDPGEHALIIKAKLHADLTKRITIKKGESQKFLFKLDQLKTIGKLVVNANIRGATIFVNGKPEGRTPRAEPIVLSEKVYQVSVEKDGYKAVTRTVDLKANQTVTMFANLWLSKPPSTWKEPLGWATFGIGVALLAGGVVGHFFAKDEFTGSTKFKQYELYQNLGYGIGGGLIGIGLLFIIWEAADASHIKPEDAVAGASAITVKPLVSASGNGGVVGAGVQF